MANIIAKVTQAELTRYLKAYRNAGIQVSRTEIENDGKVSIFTITEEATILENDWDK